MNKLINIIGGVVLFGILLKLSYVFVFLFGELDDDSFVSQSTGVTFAFASIYFVIKVPATWLKAVMVALDVITILYFYLHETFSIPIEYASIIVSLYSGLIVYYLGRVLGDRLRFDSEQASKRMEEMENERRTSVEQARIESEIERCRRRIRQSRTAETRERHEKSLQEWVEKLDNLRTDK
jgi:membrane protein implicated in regulation of membrane protease activity